MLHQCSPIGKVSFCKVVSTDVSLRGLRALCDSKRGLDTAARCKLQLNYLELLEAFLPLRHFLSVLTDQHVLIRLGNMKVVSYINRKGEPIRF